MDPLERIKTRIRELEVRYQRSPGSVRLLAVSKGQPLEKIQSLQQAGQTEFGENYVSEAIQKMAALQDQSVQWHFIGPLQSNKTRAVASHFSWVQSVDRLKLIQRLNDQRPEHLNRLNVLIQVNLQGESSKRGVDQSQVLALAEAISGCPRLKLRGLMSVPPPREDFDSQRRQFAQVRECYQRLICELPEIDTLSMGMSGDMPAAIAEGATMVRIGTALFGPRPS